MIPISDKIAALKAKCLNVGAMIDAFRWCIWENNETLIGEGDTEEAAWDSAYSRLTGAEKALAVACPAVNLGVGYYCAAGVGDMCMDAGGYPCVSHALRIQAALEAEKEDKPGVSEDIQVLEQLAFKYCSCPPENRSSWSCYTCLNIKRIINRIRGTQ